MSHNPPMRQALIACFWLFAGVAWAQQPPAGVLRQIVPGHYLYSTGTFNSGVIVTSDGAVVLDALASESAARAAREAITRATGQPVRVLVSGTHHNQYSKGNVAYADVLKVGHENYRTDRGYEAQRETAVRRLYRQFTGTLP